MESWKFKKIYRKNLKIMLKYLHKIMFYEKKNLIDRGGKWKKKLLLSILVHSIAN